MSEWGTIDSFSYQKTATKGLNEAIEAAKHNFI
jgi:hypothetical protein